MSAIAVEDRQYKTYVVSNDQGQFEVVPERGGIVTRWRAFDQEIFYLDEERFKDASKSVRGGIPLLFPICGNTPDDTYTLNGQAYSLVQHGFARTSPWQVTAQTEGDEPSITVSLESSDETRSHYPFTFRLDFVYTLKGNTLEQRYRHTNLTDQPMPFSTGIHPYFAVSDKSQLDIALPSTEYKVKGDPGVNYFSGKFDFSQEEIDYAFVNLTGQTATVTDHGTNLALTISYDSCYSTLVFWTVKGKDFYCLEPWSGPRNAINTGEHLLTAAPGETVETVITMTMKRV
ncbi:MAG: aldose epimerase [Cyanobacteria bacterium P01_D01_bin.14]